MNEAEAPERIYISQRFCTWRFVKTESDHVEYIRADKVEAQLQAAAERERGLREILLSERYECKKCNGGPCYCRGNTVVPTCCIAGVGACKWQALTESETPCG